MELGARGRSAGGSPAVLPPPASTSRFALPISLDCATAPGEPTTTAEAQKEVYARRGCNKMPPVNGTQLDPPVRRWARYRLELAAAAILLVMGAVLVSVILRKSITTDEIVLIPSAYYHWVDADVGLIEQHPPLIKLLAGLPLLFLQPNEWKPETRDPAARPDQNEWGYVMHFWQDNRPQFETICFWSRLPMIALTIALGALVFVFARELGGGRVALLATTLFALEPTILAHGRIVQTDIPAAFGLLLTVYAAWKYLREPSWKTACFLGSAAALALLAKYSMLVLAPAIGAMFAVLFCWPGARRAAVTRDAVIAAVAFVLVVNAAYFFHNRALTPGDIRWMGMAFPESFGLFTAAVRIARWVLPTDLIMGIYWQIHHARIGHSAGLLGMYSEHGWWYYFPVAFSLKATIPFLILSVISISWAGVRVVRGREGRWLYLLIPFFFYTALMLRSPIDIGVRYYLPAYTFLAILSAVLLDFLWRDRPSKIGRFLGRTAAAVALVWICFETAWAYPNYIPYLNQLASARPHWWYLSDSNVEWGDDSRELAFWLRSRGENRVRGLLLGCFATLDFYQVNYVDALATTPDPPPRYTALGASFLNGSTVPPYEVGGRRVSEEVRVNTFDSYRNRKPEAIIGDSIYIYRDGD